MNDVAVRKGNNTGFFFTKTIPKYFLLIATLLLIISFGIIRSDYYNLGNLMNILQTASVLGMMGLGLSIVIAVGEFDFAIGAEVTITAVVIAKLLDLKNFHSYPLAAIIGIIAVALLGLINAYCVVYIGMPAFVATLGTSTLVIGIAKYLTGGNYLFSMNWPKSFTFIGQYRIFKVIPVAVLIFIIICIIIWIFTERTKTGRYIYSVGANIDACNHVGINTKKYKAIAFVLCAVLCGISGILFSSTINNVYPAMGSSNLLSAISICMLGATFLKPGMQSTPGIVVAAILMAAISNGLSMLGASIYIKDIVQGSILLVSIGIIALIRKGGLPSVVI